MCCGGGADTSGQVAQAQASERVGMRQLDLAERSYEDTKKLNDEFLDLIRNNAESEEQVKQLQLELMGDERDRRQNIFNPLEEGLVKEAQDFDSAARISTEMGKADAAVVQAYDRAINAAGRDQLRLGVNPNSAKSLALRENAAVDVAKAAAGASTAAAERTKAKGFAMRMDAAGLGRNLATNQTAAADSALRAGQSQVSGMQSGISSNNQTTQTAQSGMSGASSSFTNAGNLYASAANTQAQESASMMQGVGSLIGTGAMLFL